MREINKSWQVITAPDKTDGTGHGLEVCGDEFASVLNTVIDLSSYDIADFDEVVGITWGGQGYFAQCVITGGAKLILCGSGGPEDMPQVKAEAGKRVTFKNCILTDFCRRGPEVQDGMIVELENCLIMNWGHQDRFCDGGFRGWLRLPWKDEHKWQRAFGAWAHDGGVIRAKNCIFTNSVKAPLWQRIVSRISHFGQAVSERGFFRALIHRDAWLSGYKRGLTAGPGGYVEAVHCYAQKGIVVDNHTDPMSEEECAKLEASLFANQCFLTDKYNGDKK